MKHPSKEILAIVGPTASGKTSLALALAQQRNAELISVDSRQVYQRLSVGTAKPCGHWKQGDYLVEGVPYHLVDFLDPQAAFSVSTFLALATHAIEKIRRRGKIPLFVGGTGLYYKALLEGLSPLPPADAELRRRLKEEADRKGRAHLHKRLSRVDPAAARAIPANNIQRLIRALEVYELTGKPISAWHREHKKDGLRLQFLGIDLPRPVLHERIFQRARQMLAGGMIEETRALLREGYAPNCPALTGLGYPRVQAYLEGRLTKEACLNLLVQDTRQYAKRQMTWFRHQLPVTWNAS